MTFPCPHCGGDIVVTPGPTPLPGWRIPDAILAQASRNSGASPEVAHDFESKPSTKRKPYNQGYDPLFLEFWNVYPLKRDKRKALNAWRNAVARAPHNLIVQGAMRYREDPNRRDEFTKYAEGWLNGDGWEDEPLPTRLNGKEPTRREVTEDDYRRITEEARRGREHP